MGDSQLVAPLSYRVRARSARVLAVLLLLAGLAACGGTDGGGGGAELSPLAREGRDIASTNACLSCHSVRAGGGAAPTWEGLAGREVDLDDGSRVTADATYLRRSINDPEAQVVAGYAPSMPDYSLSERELDAVVAYIESLSAP